ncbi:MAG: phosphotransferase family protein [Nocardioidaceae bacterium]
MTQMSDRVPWAPGSVEDLIRDPGTRGVLMAASRDPDAKLTFVVPAAGVGDRSRAALAIKIPATPVAGAAVEREGRMLVELRRSHLAELACTVPRYVESRQVHGLPVLVCTALPGTPMSVGYHQPLHTARPQLVRDDFAIAGGWLRRFQELTSHGEAPVAWAADVAADLRRRWDGHPRLRWALRRLEATGERLDGRVTAHTAVHGDFWFGNLLVRGGAVTGVVDWEAGRPSGSPLPDLARFALSYSLYLDRHTHPGHRVLGHPRLRRDGFAPGITYALHGHGWLPRTVRGFLESGLDALGLPPTLWYDVALVGVGDVAASANDDTFGNGHLELLADLPLRSEA